MGLDADCRLIQRMKHGDERAIDAFVRKYYPAILRYCRVHIWNPGDAEDAVQETFVRFFRSLDRYRHYGKAANYLYVIARNCCNDHNRVPAELSLEVLPEQGTRDTESMERSLILREALASLPDELRETAVLRYVQGLKQREIAQILGIGLPLVKYRLRRAKALLAKALDMEDYI